MSAKRINADHFSVWRRTLSDGETAKRQAPGANKPLDDTPIYPLRLCDEIKNFMQRDAILVVDGQGILNFGRQSMPTFTPGHRLNSGPFGTMGVGLPFGIGAKIAKPDKQVIVVHGDGSFGLNALELRKITPSPKDAAFLSALGSACRNTTRLLSSEVAGSQLLRGLDSRCYAAALARELFILLLPLRRTVRV